jgi:hypothetical protein
LYSTTKDQLLCFSAQPITPLLFLYPTPSTWLYMCFSLMQTYDNLITRFVEKLIKKLHWIWNTKHQFDLSYHTLKKMCHSSTPKKVGEVLDVGVRKVKPFLRCPIKQHHHPLKMSWIKLMAWVMSWLRDLRQWYRISSLYILKAWPIHER